MDYQAASRFEMPFGKFEGKTLDEIAETDAGLLYIDWLRGELDKKASTADIRLRDALHSYLEDITIAGELKKLIDSGKGYR